MIGDLNIMALMQLADGPKSGYDLMIEIGRITGTKPSPGSIYPMLSTMKKQGFVSQKKQGRRIIYSLTQKGKLHAKDVKRKKHHMLDRLQGSIGVFESLWGKQQADLMREFIASAKRGEEPLSQIHKESMAFKQTIFTLWHQGKVNTHQKQIKQILAKATHELRKLK